MTDDQRLTWDLVREVRDVMRRHGYHSADQQHTEQVIMLIRHMTGVYEGTMQALGGEGYVMVPSSRLTAPQPPGPAAVSIPAGQVKTVLAALAEAAGYKRDRAAACADCADQSCGTCQWWLKGADAYDQTAAQITQAAEPSADLEAGQ